MKKYKFTREKKMSKCHICIFYRVSETGGKRGWGTCVAILATPCYMKNADGKCELYKRKWWKFW